MSKPDRLYYSQLTPPQKRLIDLFFNNSNRKDISDFSAPISSNHNQAAEQMIINNFLVVIFRAQMCLLGLDKQNQDKVAEFFAKKIAEESLKSSKRYLETGSLKPEVDIFKIVAAKISLGKEAEDIMGGILSRAYRDKPESFSQYLQHHIKELILRNFNEERIIEQFKNRILLEYLGVKYINNAIPSITLAAISLIKLSVEMDKIVQKELGLNIDLYDKLPYWEQIRKWCVESDIRKEEVIHPSILAKAGLVIGVAAGICFAVPSQFILPAALLLTPGSAFVIKTMYDQAGTYLKIDSREKRDLVIKWKEKYGALFFEQQSTRLVYEHHDHPQDKKQKDNPEKKSAGADKPDLPAQNLYDFTSTAVFLEEQPAKKEKVKTRKPDGKASKVGNIPFDQEPEFYNHIIAGEKFKVVREKVGGIETNRYFCISEKDFNSYEKIDQNQILEHLQDLEGGRDKRRDAKGVDTAHRDKINLASGKRLFKEKGSESLAEDLGLPKEAELFSYRSDVLTHTQQDRAPKTSTSNPRAAGSNLSAAKRR